MSSRLVLLLATLAVALAMPASAFGQGADVDVTLDQFGVGGAYRPGEFVAIRVLLTPGEASGADRVFSAWVQWDVPNADGDVAEFGRAVPLTRGQTRPVWLYAFIAPDTLPGSVWTVRVYTFEDGRRGREIGGLRFGPTGNAVEITASMIGVIGPSQMGLNQLKLGQLGTGVVPTAHEDTRIIGIRPEDLCDRWEGLKGLEAIAWSGVDPQLSSAQAEALREWVRRGGHLIISLPEDTNPWGLGEPGKTELEDLFPSRAPRKDEDVPLTDLLPVLSKAEKLGEERASFPLSLRVFKDLGTGFDGLDNHYQPLIALPDGRVIAAQRIFGHGRVTLLGIDLANARLTRSQPLPNGMQIGFPQADVFWSRILGRRDDTPSSGELGVIEKEDRIARGAPGEETVGDGRAFLQDVQMSGAAGTGLGMALLLFLVYWIVAGPGGFALLKHYKRVQHAWLAFAGAAALFTALAWGGVNLIRQNEISVKHVTFLDHIARIDGSDWGTGDPQMQRGVSWMSVYLPGYGSTEVGIESQPAEAGFPAQRDLIVSWTPPRDTAQPFPNADRYMVDVDQGPNDYAMPTRSTATQLYANWLGGLDPEWGGLLRVDPEDRIRVIVDAAGNEVLTGSIINGLPGDLRDVKVIWVWSRRVPARKYRLGDDGKETAWVGRSGAMSNVGRMFALNVLPAGQSTPIPRLQDGLPGGGTRLEENIYEKYVREIERRSALASPGAALTFDRRKDHMEMLSMYRQLPPPKYMKPPQGNSPETVVAIRLLGRELDLSPWFTRPCLIVIGYLEKSACPIPIRIGGEPVESEGTTVVRWIVPLPLVEDVAFQ